MIYFTSDLHLGHHNILKARPQFQSIEEMEDYIIIQWNNTVTPKDEVYVLGDISYRASESVVSYLDRLKGRKHLIIGNHDLDWMKSIPDLSLYFQSVNYMKFLKFDKKQFCLCHYPLAEWPGSRYQHQKSSYMIHGHIHNSTDTLGYTIIKQYLPNALNASVDINNFRPVCFDELLINNHLWYGRYDKEL